MHFDESFWLAVSFVILLYVLYKPLRRSILTALDNKVEFIRMQVVEAEELKKQTSELLLQTKQQISELENLRGVIMQQAQDRAQELIAIKTKEYESAIARDKSAAESALQIKTSELSDQMRAEFLNNVTDLVSQYLTSSEIKVEDIEVAKAMARL